MRKISAVTSLILLASTLMLPQAGAANAKSGATCTKAGATSTVANVKFTCIKSGKKLVWNKGVTVVVKPTPIPTPSSTQTTTPTPKPTTTQINYYVAKDQKTLHHMEAFEGCANPTNSTAEVQVLVRGQWLPIKSIKSGWKVTPSGCPAAQLGKKDSLAWADVYLDGGVTFRWHFTGEVNIERHDKFGGYSASASFTLPPPLVVPHPVDNKYGITWQNITSRVKDISAAAYTDAQATIARNQGLASAADVFTTYISPGAIQIYPQAENGPNLMRRTFSLFAKYPHAKQVFYVATTLEEETQTFAKINLLYPSSKFMKDTYDSIYGITPKLPDGSVDTHETCKAGDGGRNTMDWRYTAEAAAIVWNFCERGVPSDHIESDHGAPHEQTHNIQIQIYNGAENRKALQPCWMKEGEAEWTQTAASTTFNEYLDMQHFHPYYKSANGLNYRQLTQTTWTPSELDEYFKEAVVMPCNTTPRQAMAYSAGTAAIEALVAIAGSESFFAVDQRIARGMKFVDAFKEIYGVTWDFAEPILSEVVAQKLTLAWAEDALTYQTRP